MHKTKSSHSPRLFNPFQHNIDILLVLPDYDGCIARSFCDQNIHNTKIIQHIEEQIANINPKTVFIANGSSRQTRFLDQINQRSNNNGRWFDNHPKLVKYLQNKIPSMNIQALKLTVSDIIHKLNIGTVMTETNQENIKHAMDCKKTLLLLTQIQYIAKKHTNKNIQINFYDDQIEILNCARKFFKKCLLLIPEHVLIKFYHYVEGQNLKGKRPKEKYTIQGDGIIIKNWEKLIIDAASLIMEKHDQSMLEKFLMARNTTEEHNISLQKVESNEFQTTFIMKTKEKIKNKIFESTLLKKDDISFSDKNKKVYIKINDKILLKINADKNVKNKFNSCVLNLGLEKIEKDTFILKNDAHSLIGKSSDYMEKIIKNKIIEFTSLEKNDISFSDKNKNLYIKKHREALIEIIIDHSIKDQFNFDGMGLKKTEKENKYIIQDRLFLFIDRPFPSIKNNIKNKTLIFNEKNYKLKVDDITFDRDDKNKKVYIEIQKNDKNEPELKIIMDNNIYQKLYFSESELNYKIIKEKNKIIIKVGCAYFLKFPYGLASYDGVDASYNFNTTFHDEPRLYNKTKFFFNNQKHLPECSLDPKPTKIGFCIVL